MNTSYATLGIVAMLTAVAFAGCTSPEPNVPDNGDEGDAAELGPDTYTLTVHEAPATATADETFTFNMTVEGDVEHATDHLGAHYGNQSTDEPSTDVYDKACNHQATTVPGEFEVTCTISEPGTYYYRGHMRIQADGETYNWWSAEHTLVVA